METYYNEIDDFAAQWLRNLGANGLIPSGKIDERSIVNVQADDLGFFRQCHFFAGIGGWPYALHLAGWPEDREVWTGSCPCQPLSSAGQRKGHADVRHLWPAFYNLIAECRPATIFGEQVASQDGREWLAGVCADLEALGYVVGCADLCAASAGAPQVRQRLFWVADLRSHEYRGKRRSRSESIPRKKWSLAKGFTIKHRRFDELVAMGVAERVPSYVEAMRLLDGIPTRMEQLRGYGNAIVPQVAAEFIKAFMEAENDPWTI